MYLAYWMQKGEILKTEENSKAKQSELIFILAQRFVVGSVNAIQIDFIAIFICAQNLKPFSEY